MAITNFEVYATRLRDERLDVKLKQTIAHELCESLEFFQLQDYTRFVAILWPVIRDLLLKTPPVFVSSAPEQRIPHSEVFRPVVLEVVTTLLALVKTENEENAVVCLKIIYELHRMYRQLLDGIALPFLDLAAEIYRNADQMLKVMDSLDTPAPLSTPNVNLMSPSAMSPGPDMGDVSTKNLSKATSSFKVLTEIPIIVVSIIQANRRHADPFVTNILPLILHMLELNPRDSLGILRLRKAKTSTGASKTLSFLAFFARGFTPLLIPFQDRIANLTLQLLCLCPAEATATRKEILIATRHIVSTDIRKAFLPIADKFLDMQVLVGSGLASQCILKPFAFSMLADLIHHIRLDLSPSQLTRMIDFYAGCMHDQSLSSGVHTMCAKLLHNITERIMLLPDKRHARILLLTILKTFTSSFAAIGNQAAAAISDIKSGGVHAEEKIYGVNELIRTNAFEQGDNIKELRFLLRSLVTGCKNVIYGLKRCDSMLAVGMDPRAQSTKAEGAEAEGTTDASGASISIFSAASTQEAQLLGFELDLLSSLFREGLRACRIHDIERIRSEVAASAAQDSVADVDDDGDGEATRSPALSREAQIKLVDREGKEQIEHFANLFINLDPAVFHELFTSQFDYAFQAMIDHCAAISSVQVFVASDPNSPAFISIMLRYLCDRLDLLGSDDEALTSTMLHLFKIAFLALALYPEANEPVLQPYVQTIINSALTISKAAKRPKNYFLLLRALFRSIGGGRYETLYKEVFPVLQNLLETLNSALGFTKLASSMQELFVEICLTVPVRLSVLLPYLSLLMKPLVFALESGPELVSQGLRTLELCIDNLTREFLDPILTPVMDEIMSSLWLHLRLPSSASTHAPVAARILGKLGGRNRHMLLTRFPVESGEQLDSGIGSGTSEDKLSVSMTFEGLPRLVSMPLMDAVMFSVKVLEDRVSTKQLELARKDAVEFIMACSRYTLVLPFVTDSQADSALEDAKSYSRQLIALTSDPLALKRLANISSPTAQGSQILERIIASCPSVGDTFKAGTPIVTNEAALTASNATLSELCSDSVVASKSMPISHSGLMHVIWALSLASVHSDAARELLLSIIAIGVRQHIIQCVEAVSPEPDSVQQDAKTHAMSLASAVPEIISRVLVSRSRRLRAMGTLMLRHFYTTLRELLSKKASLVGQLPAMQTIVSDLCAACYDPAIDTKHSGCVGIAFIVEELDLGRTWLAENLLELSKALLFTLKDTHSNVIPSTNPAESSATLMRIIKQAFPPTYLRHRTMDCEDGSVNNGVTSDVLMSDSEPGQESNLDATFAAPKIGPLRQDGEVEGATPTPTSAIAFEKSDNASTMGANGAIDRSSGTPDPNSKFASGDRTHAPDTEQVAADGSAAPSSAVSVSTPAPAPAEMPDADIAIDNDLTKSAADAGEEPVSGAADADAAASEADAVDKSRQEGMAAATQRAMLAFKRLLARLSPDNNRLLNNEVRDAAKACLDILVDVTGCSVTALLLPSRDRLLIPIFGKPLRALPHNMQIGNIDAITYCLSLDPPFLEINEELLRLLSEALALADAEDQALVNHPAQVRTNTMSLTHLRHVCIRMLTSAMVRPEFADAKNTPTRARIISVFFKSLYHKSVEVVDAANDGLKQVLLQQQKLPRDLLQTGLRPILLNLSDYKRLTVASLDGLARLLQLLTNYFKVEVGRKLLDHMQQWANPHLLQAASEKSIEDMNEIKILVAILQVFHLLPSTAGVLLDDLVGSVVNLEVHLCRRESSPFRKPLFKFLNRYPTESVVYFVERIESTHYARIFVHALSSSECSPLREALMSQTPLLVNILREFCIHAEASSNANGSSTSSSVDAAVDAMAVDSEGAPNAAGLPTRQPPAYSDAVSKRLYIAMEAATMIHACLEFQPLWLEERSDLLQTLFATWTASTSLGVAPTSPLGALPFTGHARDGQSTGHFIQATDVAGRSSSVIDVSFVFKYVWDSLIVRWPISKRREILTSDESNAILLQHLINPMVATVFTLPDIALTESASDTGSSGHDGSSATALSSTPRPPLTQEQRGIELLRAPVIAMFNQRVWAVHMPNGAQALLVKRASVRLELVQLSSILIRHAASAVNDIRKDIIKFGWNYIRNDDIMIKNASYVLVAQFIAAFDTPSKIILQAYSSLLKAHHVESRFLVRQALDILLPVLPIRLPPTAQQGNSGESGNGAAAGPPAWVVLAKRILIENSASLAHTTHVYQLIAGHPSIFFPYRTQFASNLVGILQKMCLTHSATSETRTLALDIMDLKDAETVPAGEADTGSKPGVNANGSANTSTSTPVLVPAASVDLLMSESRRETIVGLLLRMLCLVFDFALKSNLGPRALELLTQYLDSNKWPTMHLRLTFFERSMQQIEAQGMNQQLVLHILTVLSVVTNQMQPIWFEEYFGVLVGIVRKCMTVDNGQVQKIVASILRQLYEQAAANERLGSSPIVADLKAHDNTNIYGTLLTLHAIGEHTGEQLFSHIPQLMKFVQRYTKEHNSHSASGSQAASGAQQGTGTAPPSLQPSTSASSHNVATRVANTSADILQLVASSAGQIPLTVEALVKGETPLDILLMLLLLLRDHISRLGDQRRSFLTHIIQLIERNGARVGTGPAGGIPDDQGEGDANVVMMSFVHGSASASDNASRASVRAGAGSDTDGGDPFALLERKYLGLVLEVYNDVRFTRSEMTMRLEQAFLSGMQSEDSEMRGRFLATFDANMPGALSVRLNYLLETQNWESVSSTFWLQHRQAQRKQRRQTREPMDIDLKADSDAGAATVGSIFAYRMWVTLFPLLWQGLGPKDQHDLTSGVIRLLAKPYHQAQTGMRPNVIQAILDAFCECQPAPRLPPQLLRYLGQTYCAWYPALSLLETKLLERRELGAFDALTELYSALAARHYFYGAWKRHCQYRESHIALAYEQLDDWAGAQAAYERAQTKARAGVLPFSESEYCLWETRWVEATKRLQNWDMLLDLGLHESLPEIELDAGWRVWDWAERNSQTFLTLARGSGAGTGTGSKTADFQRMCKEGIRACLQQWNELPGVGTPSHISLLHMFQLMVELGDASNIYASLAATKADNLESKSGDLKSVLQTWRERLPNNSDPINVWSDLVAWRQHVFKAINDVYVPFISQQQQKAAVIEDVEGDSSSVAAAAKPAPKTKGTRKAGDSEPDSTTKDDSGAGANGGSVATKPQPAGAISGSGSGSGSGPGTSAATTAAAAAAAASAVAAGSTPSGNNNSVLTSYAYRGYHEMAWIINRFAHVARLHGLVDVCIGSLTRIYTLPNIEIQEAFLKLREQAKCYYHRPHELQSGLDFFTLKGQFLAKLGKLDEANHAFATGIQFDLGSPKAWAAWGRYNDERFCSNMPDTTGAVNAISCYMQAAGLCKRPRVRRYLARTLWLLSQDDAAGNSEMPTWYWIARQAQQILLRIAKQYPQALHYALRTAREEAVVARQRQAGEVAAPAAAAAAAPSLAADELMAKLKTAHPLLTLSMETMINQIVHRLKPCPEEDIYRLVHALLGDGLQQLHAGGATPVDTIVANTCRVALSLPAGGIKARFERDFGAVRGMDLCAYVTRLYQWQQMLRRAIRRRPRALMLSLFSPFLVEFEQQKFEDVEVPGQYLRLSDTGDDFVRIERFMPALAVVLRNGSVARTLAVRGSDGSVIHFAVQHFTSRHNHQEERWAQLYRNLDVAAEQDRDAWVQRRAPDAFTLQDVYDTSCARTGIAEIAPALYHTARMRELAPSDEAATAAAAAGLFEHICQHMVSPSLLADDNFSFQVAVSIALTYIIASAQRTPAKLAISRASGNISLAELVPMQATPGLIHSAEPVPFRLTPAIQAFVTELGLEGILPFAVHKVVQRLAEREHLLRDFLDLYVRDELIHMPSVRALAAVNPAALAEMCDRNVKLIVHRAAQLAEILPPKDVQDKELSPMQPLIHLMAQAVAPANLAQMDYVWMPWL
ncbi:hypothetical protein BX661DRAFT_199084 [Kickxella alabastrina]|uniref:uncharacterized protein n=1 Tax=Kickxella alabastrina TaxID=61397 RepID=UPI00221F0A59|nr:uncharacterized protein BX661DRAFT_199084 [Kickxella alabastrina]KAI7825787.1 hypothetical protein BX661DRAFT_199084 [Kickxella alabastrina]